MGESKKQISASGRGYQTWRGVILVTMGGGWWMSIMGRERALWADDEALRGGMTNHCEEMDTWRGMAEVPACPSFLHTLCRPCWREGGQIPPLLLQSGTLPNMKVATCNLSFRVATSFTHTYKQTSAPRANLACDHPPTTSIK